MVVQVPDSTDLEQIKAKDAAQDADLAANKQVDAAQAAALAKNDQDDARQDQALADLKTENAELRGDLAELKALILNPHQDEPVDPPQSGPAASLTVGADVWTIGPNHETLKNGTRFGGGLGTLYRLSDDGAVQVLGDDGNWYQVSGESWVKVTDLDPTPPVETPPADDPPVDGEPVETLPAKTGPYMRPQRVVALPQIRRMPSDLVAAKLMLPFAKARKAPQYPKYNRGSYKSVGLTPYMGATGERQEIGLVTDAEGQWLCGGDPNNMLVQAEAHADVPVHFGKVDLNVTPWATTYAAQGKGAPYFDTTGYDVQPETAHYPSLSFIAYLATGDIFYLEELQAEATYQSISSPGLPGYRPLLDGGQPRGLAWTLRALASAFLATREAEKAGMLPDTLLPSAYWKARLDVYRDALLETYVKSADARVQAFRTMVNDYGYWIAPWEQDFLGAVLGWMIWTGRFEDWRDIYDWSIQQAIRRAAFGDRAIGYHWKVGDATDYASLIAANPEPITDASYRAYYRANLGIAVLNKVPGADGAFALADRLAADFVPSKWAIDVSLAA